MKHHPPANGARWLSWCLLVAIGGLGGLCRLAFGDTSPPTARLPVTLFSDSFTTSEYYTNKAQIRMRLSGNRAQPSGQGRYLLKQLRLETFHEDGQPEVLIEAPECLYDLTARTASSPGSLRILMGDGRLILTGEGFLWQQAQTSLIISNRVRTLVRELPNQKAKP